MPSAVSSLPNAGMSARCSARPQDWNRCNDGARPKCKRDAWRRQAERLRASWDRASVEIDELRAIGDERVVARIRYLTEGGDKAISFDTAMGAMFVLVAGKIVRGEYFWSFDQALEAAKR